MTSAPRALALVAALVTAAGLAGPAAAGPADRSGVAHARAATTAAERADVAAYWTPARMRAATPADVLAPVVSPAQVAPPTSPAAAAR